MVQNSKRSQIIFSSIKDSIGVGDMVYVKMWPTFSSKTKHPFVLFGFNSAQECVNEKHIKEIAITPPIYYLNDNTGGRYAHGVVISEHIQTYKTQPDLITLKKYFKVILANQASYWFLPSDVSPLHDKHEENFITVVQET